MFGTSKRTSMTGSKAYASESAFCFVSFALLLLVVDAVLTASIFVSAEILGVLVGILVSVLVSVLVCLIIIAVLLPVREGKKRPGLSAA